MMYTDINDTGLGKEDLLHTYSFVHSMISSRTSEVFDRHILELSDFLGFEFAFYGYMQSIYTHRDDAVVVNLTSPGDWMKAFFKLREHNPLIDEIERLYHAGESIGYSVWDQYGRTLSKGQQDYIARRSEFGLEFGCSIFATSGKKNFSICISLGSRANVPDARTESIARMIIYPVMVTKKRLIMQGLVDSLTEKEKEVADQIISGRSCRAIGQHLAVSENTVKFHLKNIYSKLNVNNRQQVTAILLAEHYLSL